MTEFGGDDERSVSILVNGIDVGIVSGSSRENSIEKGYIAAFAYVVKGRFVVVFEAIVEIEVAVGVGKELLIEGAVIVLGRLEKTLFAGVIAVVVVACAGGHGVDQLENTSTENGECWCCEQSLHGKCVAGEYNEPPWILNGAWSVAFRCSCM